MPSVHFLETVKEDANFNQYWYSPLTIHTLVEEILMHGKRVAFLSTPSLFFHLMEVKSYEEGKSEMSVSCSKVNLLNVQNEAVLFEFDKQFEIRVNEIFSERDKEGVDDATSDEINKTQINAKKHFVLYDYNKWDRIPMKYMGYFDYIVADPPFITKDVWEKYMRTIKIILSNGSDSAADAKYEQNTGFGKVLFTSILDNHAMLEDALGMPLFIAPFMPSIPNLVYQYFIFTNYSSTPFLSSTNWKELCFGNLTTKSGETRDHKEVEEERKLLTAIRLANDMRESQIEFAHQMRTRDRKNDDPLTVVLRYGSGGEMEKTKEDKKGEVDFPEEAVTAAAQHLDNKPLEKMPWGYIPEELQKFATSNQEEIEITDFGPFYNKTLKVRQLLQEVRNAVDKLHKICNEELKRKRNTDNGEPSNTDVHSVQKDKEIVINSLREIKAELKSLCDNTEEIKESVNKGEIVIDQIIASYSDVPLSKSKLQELAAEATRKYKTPLFSKGNLLLQLMKKQKAEYIASLKK